MFKQFINTMHKWLITALILLATPIKTVIQDFKTFQDWPQNPSETFLRDVQKQVLIWNSSW